MQDRLSPDAVPDQGGAESRRTDAQGFSLDMMTPAQAYAYAVKTGQDVNRTLHFTIERKQPLRTAHFQQPATFRPSNGGGGDDGGIHARRLYASAIGARSLTNLPSNTAMSAQLLDPPSGGSATRQTSSTRRLNRNAFPAPFNTDPPSIQTFNAADFYHSSLPLRSIRTFESGAFTSVTKEAPLSAPPAAPSPPAKYSQFHTSHTQTEVAQPPFGTERSPTPCSSLEAPLSDHRRPRPLSQDFRDRDPSSSHPVSILSSTSSLARLSVSCSPSEKLGVIRKSSPAVDSGREQNLYQQHDDIQRVRGVLVVKRP